VLLIPVVRVAWFSPVPPSRSGIAAYTAEVVPLLRERLLSIDLFVDPTGIGAPFPTDRDATLETGRNIAPEHPRTRAPEHSAHEFVWRHRRDPYDLTVYQLGNAECHNYMWAYLFRYPGLVVLHDAQLHQSRALWLLKRLKPRRDDYFAELRANHPDAPADLGELIAAGLGGLLYHQWPMVSLVMRASRLTAVHSERLADALGEAFSGAGHADGLPTGITAIPMGVKDPGPGSPATGAAVRVRAGIPDNAIVIAAYGGITPEKRIPQLLRAVAAQGEPTPPWHVLLVGARAPHYDVDADARRLGLERRVHVAGYVPDDDLAAYLHAADIACCLRWPTNRETSASWLRCLAAARPTVFTRLWHLEDVPDDAAVAIDVLDEDRSLAAALARLLGSGDLRRAMGARGRAWWEAHHQLPAMADAYQRAIAEAADRPIPHPTLPRHLLDDGSGTVDTRLAEMGIPRARIGM
jgi:glycosyltransferase involved in cell wall biosynthesis